MNTNFASLEFFSKHFNAPLDKLSWAIVEDIVEGTESALSLAISIKDTNLFIDVEQKRIRSEYSLPGRQAKLHPATMKQNNQMFLAINEENDLDIEFSYQNLKDLYQYYWYDEKLIGTTIL